MVYGCSKIVIYFGDYTCGAGRKEGEDGKMESYNGKKDSASHACQSQPLLLLCTYIDRRKKSPVVVVLNFKDLSFFFYIYILLFFIQTANCNDADRKIIYIYNFS